MILGMTPESVTDFYVSPTVDYWGFELGGEIARIPKESSGLLRLTTRSLSILIEYSRYVCEHSTLFPAIPYVYNGGPSRVVYTVDMSTQLTLG